MSTDSQSFSPLSRQAVWLDSFEFRLRLAEQGRVISVGDGIAWIEGLPSAAMEAAGWSFTWVVSASVPSCSVRAVVSRG